MKEKGKLKYFGHIPSRLDVDGSYQAWIQKNHHRYK